MKFRNNDPAKWTQVRMVRENNKKEFKNPNEEMPKFGAGSEYGREEREEARRKKYGYASKKYDPDNQPWLMRVGGKKDGKHYRGQREGGISENASYYVFLNQPGRAIEAIPIKEWYNFIPRVAYKTLDAEEAEEKFAQRGTILNMWALKINKKLKPEDEGAEIDDDETKKSKKSGKKTEKEFKISDMDDELMGSGDELDSDSDEEADKKKPDSDDESDKKKNKGKKKKKSPDEVDNEAFEDSDDGEGEGREVDYMSDESSDEEEIVEAQHDIAGVDQDEGLAKMLDSDESDEEENEAKDEKDETDETNEKKGKKDENGKKSGKNSGNNSRSTSPAPEAKKEDEKSSKAEKRKQMVDSLLDPNAEPSSKKGRFEGPSTSQPVSGSLEAGLEEDVRKYLSRKPMTTVEIMRKMTSKKTGLSKEALMPLIVNILKRINPHKQKVKGIMYLSLKTGK